MDEKQKQIVELKTKITNLESELTAAKRALFELDNEATDATQAEGGAIATPEGKVIEGIFNGENMIGPAEKVFPVPANYASKSKLVEGDRLKLTINSDGSFVFKQIGPIDRRNLTGQLKFENNAYIVEADGHQYHVLYASVTYHKVQPGDQVSITIPASGESNWAALEGVIHDVPLQNAVVLETVQEPIPVNIPPVNTVSQDLPSPMTTQEEVAPVTPLETAPPQEADEAMKSNLGIDELEIVGKQQAPAPTAVDPGTVNPGEPITVSPSIIKPKTVSELEI